MQWISGSTNLELAPWEALLISGWLPPRRLDFGKPGFQKAVLTCLWGHAEFAVHTSGREGKTGLGWCFSHTPIAGTRLWEVLNNECSGEGRWLFPFAR